MNDRMPVDNVNRVDVVLERRVKRSGQWGFIDWLPVGIAPAQGGATGRQVIHEDDSCRRELWRGFEVRLAREAAASYWSNLMAAQPSVFVVCRRDEADDDLKPFLVTVDFDEVVDYQDAGDEVFRLALPPAVYQWVERFLVDHCEPPRQGKRQRARRSENE